METTANAHKELLLANRQHSVETSSPIDIKTADSAVPVEIRTAFEAAELLSLNERSLEKWFSVVSERLNARNARKSKGLSAKRLEKEANLMLRYFSASGVKDCDEVTPKIATAFFHSAWPDHLGNMRRPGLDRMESRQKVARAVFEEAIALGASIDPAVLVVSQDPDLLVEGQVDGKSVRRAGRPMRRDQAGIFRQVIDITYRGTGIAVSSALMMSGVTATETAKVRKCDIDLQARTVRIRGKAARVNPLSTWAANAIRLYLENHPALDDDALLCVKRVFYARPRQSPDNGYVYLLVKYALREAGFDSSTGITPDSLRFGTARQVLETSGIAAAARFLGYTSLDRTARTLEYKWKNPSNKKGNE
ncbi:MAG: hypothetical protein OXH29_00215 [bacterium]|nr:hypothetical protein [bacterium]